ncbi:probable 3-beta-hydroxysteroid-Delta(8),Delta(7)-isomerase [Momordica charantia]|uniref:Probable 3-beta-hydroxysteroid-Delta(8),Delta(7)-isomerase n=1 Tax=Momordica charantia TaxID=3673 RepID=A0A6J1E0U0_MOMCH|nr:probable 3-beta-hydroxysteroid-Delta(8),Delta(7)-isomerase [Momordica charantia]
MAGKSEAAPHPYVPADLQLSEYVPVSLPFSTIIGVYFLSSILVTSLVWTLSGRLPKKAKIERLLMCWWVFTGLTHMILEGYFVFSPEFYKDKTSFYLAEVWKEYSKGDSRYAARESGIVSIEGLTSVLEGPACILAMYAIATEKSYSYILQFAISLGQLYGTFLYYITAVLDGDNFSSGPFYYYAYYVVANSFWILIPSLIAIRCWKKICAAMNSEGHKKRKIR